MSPYQPTSHATLHLPAQEVDARERVGLVVRAEDDDDDDDDEEEEDDLEEYEDDQGYQDMET